MILYVPYHVNNLLCSLTEANSYGNFFNPASACSDVAENVPDARDGVYWIKTKNGPKKVSLCAICNKCATWFLWICLDGWSMDGHTTFQNSID